MAFGEAATTLLYVVALRNGRHGRAPETPAFRVVQRPEPRSRQTYTILVRVHYLFI